MCTSGGARTRMRGTGRLRFAMRQGAGVHETSSVGPNGACNCHTSAASGCPVAVLVRWPQFGVRQAAAVLARKVSSGTVRYSLWPPKLRPLGGCRLRAARGAHAAPLRAHVAPLRAHAAPAACPRSPAACPTQPQGRISQDP